MDHQNAFIVIGFAALIHASFQLSTSVLTLLSAHSLGERMRHTHLMRLATTYCIGAIIMTLLLLSTLAFVLQNTVGLRIHPLIAWGLVCGLSVGTGIAVWALYYRYKQAGTALWLPRSMARFLADRAKTTRHEGETFTLGMMSVITEILFIIAPLSIAALVLIQLPSVLQLLGLGLYGSVATSSLVAVYMLIGGGKPISVIQRWREHNKRFLQFTAGSALIILAAYLYVDQVIAFAGSGVAL